jgi:hypothetical protein
VIDWPRPRVVAVRAARFLVVLTALSLPAPGIARTYRWLTEAVALSFVSAAASPVTFTFGGQGPKSAAAPDDWTLRVRADDPVTGQFVETALDLRRSGFLASAVFIALALAAPELLRRRWGIRGVVGTLVLGVLALQILPALALVAFFSGRMPVQAFHPPAVGRSALETAYRALVAAPGMVFILPGLLWLAVARPFATGLLRVPAPGAPASRR